MAQYLNVDHELPEQARVWLATVLPGTRLLDATWLTGGIDHGNHEVAVVDESGQRRSYVLRRWIRPDWRERDPDYTVEREQSALELLERVGAPTPRLVATDPAGEVCDRPALLMTWLAGDPPPERLPDSLSDVDAMVAGLADAAQDIHAVHPAGAGIPAYEPYHDLVAREVPVDALDKGVWVGAMNYLADVTDPAGDTFIHRDYHPYNVLWRGSEVIAVIDWSTASIGHPDHDVAHMRWNLAVSYGYEVADRFRLAVQARTGRTYNRHWDARAIIDLIPSLLANEELAPDLPELGRTTHHGDPTTRMATLERLLREALP